MEFVFFSIFHCLHIYIIQFKENYFKFILQNHQSLNLLYNFNFIIFNFQMIYITIN